MEKSAWIRQWISFEDINEDNGNGLLNDNENA